MIIAINPTTFKFVWAYWDSIFVSRGILARSTPILATFGAIYHVIRRGIGKSACMKNKGCGSHGVSLV